MLAAWRAEGAVVQDETPAIWPLEQDYVGPDGRAVRAADSSRACGLRTTARAASGRMNAPTRVPSEDRLRLTRATQANLSPIFALFSDPEQRAWKALEPATESAPWAQTTDPDGTVNRLWRVEDPEAIAAVQAAARDAELLIADGHHRYETARVYAEEVGGEGPHRYVLMCLVALEDPGLTVFPTHRLVRDLAEAVSALRQAIEADFTMTPLDSIEELPPAENERLELGYIDVTSSEPSR